MTWWDHRGTAEWLSYHFPKARTIGTSEVYWFDDTDHGACRVPVTWKLLWLDGSEWKPVQLTGSSTYTTALDRFNKVTFEPVTTRELKLEVQLQPRFSGGVLRWWVGDAAEQKGRLTPAPP